MVSSPGGKPNNRGDIQIAKRRQDEYLYLDRLTAALTPTQE
jgi:hypothetical protein